MAVSVDTVYQRVLALANKEQRGYITPQEFNLLANQAQMSVFESYFYSLNTRDRQEPARSFEVDETDISELIAAKLNPFRSISTVSGGTNFQSTISVNGTEYDVFQTGRVFHNGDVCQKVDINEARRYTRSIRHIATTVNQGAIYCDSTTNGQDINVYAGSSTIESNVTAEYFRVPVAADWSYVVVSDVAMYNANVSVNFELHKSEEDTIVNKILELAGITIAKAGLTQVAGQMSAGEVAVSYTHLTLPTKRIV